MRRDYDDDGRVEPPTRILPTEKRFLNSTRASVAAKSSPGAENSKFHSGDHDHSQHGGRWDLQQSRRNLEDDSDVGGAKDRLETSDPGNVSTIDEWGDEGPCNHHDNDDLSHQPPWELSDYASSLTL